MKILAVHNHYQIPGGEDAVFRAETAMLEAHGHRVIRYTAHNKHVDELGRLTLACRAVWNEQVNRDITNLVRRELPDVMHVHNTVPLISPAVYRAAHREGVGVVQTLHNYRMLCPGALFFRDGRICEDCLGRSTPWPGIVHGCYRDNRAATAVVTVMLTAHRAMGTWSEAVDTYIAPSEFVRDKFIAGGMAAHKIAVKPNFVESDPGAGLHRGGYALFVGRHSPEKGLHTLLAAWAGLDDIPLKIAGGIPAPDLAASASRSVAWVGRPSDAELICLMQDAAILIFPSEVYEGFPVTIAQAYSTGLPVAASRLGAMGEIVEDGRTGVHFTAGDAEDLRRVVRRVFADPALLQAMSGAARAEYETKYTAHRNLQLLTEIYCGARVSQPSGSLATVAGSS